ncbi:MAG: ribbon-helix-helix domain-containing protein [Desulfurococcaceae archaeon]
MSKAQPRSKRWIRTTVQIPEEMYAKVKEIMQRHGYRTFSEFVRDLIRERIEKV